MSKKEKKRTVIKQKILRWCIVIINTFWKQTILDIINKSKFNCDLINVYLSVFKWWLPLEFLLIGYLYVSLVGKCDL